MIKTFEMSQPMRIGTALLRFLMRLGLPLGSLKLLVHEGRKSGKQYSTPVALVEQDGSQWLVAAFGDVNWVKNIRAAGKAQFQQGQSIKTFDIIELKPAEAAPILKKFIQSYGFVPFIPPYFNADASASVAEFEREASYHPVFRLVGAK